MLVMAFEGKIGHACASWTELVHKCGYKAVVTKQECGDFIVEIKPDNTYSKLVPPFEQLYSEEYGGQEAVEDLCEEFAKKFLSKSWRVMEGHQYREWAFGKQVEHRSPWHDV